MEHNNPEKHSDDSSDEPITMGQYCDQIEKEDRLIAQLESNSKQI
jgi:hypothetical protein